MCVASASFSLSASVARLFVVLTLQSNDKNNVSSAQGGAASHCVEDFQPEPHEH